MQAGFFWITWIKQFTEWSLKRREITPGSWELDQVNFSPLQIKIGKNDLEIVFYN